MNYLYIATCNTMTSLSTGISYFKSTKKKKVSLLLKHSKFHQDVNIFFVLFLFFEILSQKQICIH